MTQQTHKLGFATRVAKWVVICAVGFVYAGFFGEAFLRVMDPQLRMPRFITGTDYGIRGNIPNAVYRQVTPEADVIMRINAQGMRSNQEFTLEKPAGVCRIGLMGDSYFMGYEAEYDDTVGALLETRLSDLGYRIEVLNFAVSGFSTEEMLREFEARTVNYDPDIVIAQFGAGDFEDNMRPGLYKLDAAGIPQPTNASYLPGVSIRDRLMQSAVYRMLINHSHLYSGVREWAGLTVKKILTKIGSMRRQKDASATNAPVEGAAESLRKIQTRYTSALLELSHQRAEAFGIEWFMLEVPVPIYKAYLSSVDELELDDATMDRVISPIAKFDKHPRSEPWLYREKGHSHFSPSGHSLVTDALIEGMFDKVGGIFEHCKK